MSESSHCGLDWLYVPLLEVLERAEIRVRQTDEQGEAADAPELEFECSSSDEEIVQVEGRTLIGVRPGTAEITLTALHGNRRIEVRRQIRIVEAPDRLDWGLKRVRPSILFLSEERQVLRQKLANPDANTDGLGIDVRAVREQWELKAEEYVKEKGFTVQYPSAPRTIDYPLPPLQPGDIPQPAGYVDYPFWTMYSRGLEDRLIALGILYSLTDEERYAEKAKQYLLALSGFHRWYEFGHRGAEGNLSNAHLVLGVATAYDLLHGYLADEERRIIRRALVEKGLRPLGVDYGNTDHHNIVVAKQVAMMIGALAIQDEEPHVGKYILGPYAYMLDYLDQRATAQETEGLMYDNIAARHIAQAAFALFKATGHDALSAHSYLTRLIPDKFFYFQAAGYRPSFANLSDCNPSLDLAYLMSMLADHGNGAAMWYVRQYSSANPVVLLNVTKGTKPIPPDTYFEGRKSEVFRPIGWASLRSGWGERDHMLAFTSSASARDHNHEDQNHFVLNVAGEWLITDPGYQDYVPGPRHDFTVGTVGHNALLVNGAGQAKRGGGTLEEWFASPEFGIVAGEAADSYGGAIRSWKRTICHVDEAYYLLVDEVDAGRPSDRLELLFHTKGSVFTEDGEVWKPDGQLRQARKVRFGGEAASVFLEPCHPQALEAGVFVYPGAEAYGPYLSLQQKSDHTGRAVFAVLLEPAPDHASLYAVQSGRAGDVLHFIVQRTDSSVSDEVVFTLHDGDLSSLRSAKALRYRGRAAWASLAAGAQTPSKLTLVQGTELSCREQLYWRSDIAAKVSVLYEEDRVTLTLNMAADSGAAVYLPFEPRAFKGITGFGDTDYDRETGILSLRLPAGKHTVEFCK